MRCCLLSSLADGPVQPAPPGLVEQQVVARTDELEWSLRRAWVLHSETAINVLTVTVSLSRLVSLGRTGASRRAAERRRSVSEESGTTKTGSLLKEQKWKHQNAFPTKARMLGYHSPKTETETDRQTDRQLPDKDTQDSS